MDGLRRFLVQPCRFARLPKVHPKHAFRYQYWLVLVLLFYSLFLNCCLHSWVYTCREYILPTSGGWLVCVEMMSWSLCSWKVGQQSLYRCTGRHQVVRTPTKKQTDEGQDWRRSANSHSEIIPRRVLAYPVCSARIDPSPGFDCASRRLLCCRVAVFDAKSGDGGDSGKRCWWSPGRTFSSVKSGLLLLTWVYPDQ